MENAEGRVYVFVGDASCNAAGVDVLTVHQTRVECLPISLQCQSLVPIPHTSIDYGSVRGCVWLQLGPLQVVINFKWRECSKKNLCRMSSIAIR